MQSSWRSSVHLRKPSVRRKQSHIKQLLIAIPTSSILLPPPSAPSNGGISLSSPAASAWVQFSKSVKFWPMNNKLVHSFQKIILYMLSLTSSSSLTMPSPSPRSFNGFFGHTQQVPTLGIHSRFLHKATLDKGQYRVWIDNESKGIDWKMHGHNSHLGHRPRVQSQRREVQSQIGAWPGPLLTCHPCLLPRSASGSRLNTENSMNDLYDWCALLGRKDRNVEM